MAQPATGGRDPFTPVRDYILDGRAGCAIQGGSEPLLEALAGVRDSAQPPEAQQVVEVAIVLRPPRPGRRGRILGPELLVVLTGKNAKNLHRVIWVRFIRRLRRHRPIILQPSLLGADLDLKSPVVRPVMTTE
jgi:hypothetical protein